MESKVVLLLLCFACVASGCHWYRIGRKKRSTAAEVTASDTLRAYFSICMATKVMENPAIVGASGTDYWVSVVDFTILDSTWYINTNQWFCSSASAEDTAVCWQTHLSSLVQATSSLFTLGTTCIAEYAEDVATPPVKLRYLMRKKRQTSTSTQSVARYSSCVSSSVQLIRQRTPLNYEHLTHFIREHAVFGCEACELSCERPRPAAREQSYNNTRPPQWPYRFLAMTRPDSPLRNVIAECNDVVFPGPPFWSAWSAYNPSCPKCGGSLIPQSRTRTCRSGVDPQRQEHPSRCPGPAIDRRICPSSPPCLPPDWSQWQKWSPDCPSCGIEASRRRIRYCWNQFQEQVDSNQCFGFSEQVESCTVRPCWDPWGKWSTCPACGQNIVQTRTRTCSVNQCQGASQMSRACALSPCRPHSWGEWKGWAPSCPACGITIIQHRHRLCHSPSGQQVASRLCPGSDQEEQSCNVPSCQPNFWGNWGLWLPPCPRCSLRPVTQVRSRTCLSPTFATLTESDCVGQGRQQQFCLGLPPCQTSSWLPWGQWSTCGNTCQLSRTRRCFGQCEGSSVDTKSCTGGDCFPRTTPTPLIVTWGRWDRWGPCSERCNGIQRRSRKCLYFIRSIATSICRVTYRNSDIETRTCNTQNCQTVPSPTWTIWSIWSYCVSVGEDRCITTGIHNRTRKCTSGNQEFPATSCGGSSIERNECRATCTIVPQK